MSAARNEAAHSGMTDPWCWRGMREADLPRVVALADALFPDHPEEAAHFSERLARGGDLCLSLAGAENAIGGYAVAYPWPLGRVPPLNRPLGTAPEPDGALYLHDLAVHPDQAGAGLARTGLALLVERARAAGATAIALVAVNRSAEFWRARGFAEAGTGAAMAEKLASYGPEARYMVLTF